MLSVMDVRKTSTKIPGMCKHIWLKVFLNKLIQECRDVRKSQVSTNYNKKVIAILNHKSYNCTYAAGKRLNFGSSPLPFAKFRWHKQLQLRGII